MVWLLCAGAVCVAEVPVQTLAGLAAQAEKGQPRVVPVALEGTVWWSDPSGGRVILRDESAVLQLELGLPYPAVRPGQTLILWGRCSVVQSRDALKISPVPLVENNGLHAFTEQSGTVFLKAGKHPVCAMWFNRTDKYGLSIEFEGPGIGRQPVPDAMLYRAEVAPDGSTNWINGLEYRCCEGQWWRSLPNFAHLTAVESGATGNFSLDVKTREDHVGLQFSGWFDVPREGDYTFYVSSDDGSRFFVGPSSLQVHAAPGRGLPERSPAQGLGEPEYIWSAVEGDVESVHRSGGLLELEVMSDSGLVRINVAEDSPGSYVLRPHNRIRATGASRRIRGLDGRWMRGEFFVQRWTDLELLSISPALWNDYPVARISDLQAQSGTLGESVVHLRGRVVPERDAAGRFCLEDGTGCLALERDGADVLKNRFVDLLGRVEMAGGVPVLRYLYGGEGRTGRGDKLPVLTSIEQIYQLSQEEAARQYPVRVRGVITSPMESDGAVLQDSSRGIYVVLGGPVNLQIGDYCEIEGETGPYQFSQFIDATNVKVLGTGALPQPVQPTWDQLINGSLHCNYVELEGVVTASGADRVTLLTRDGRIRVRLNPTGPAVPQDALGATVRLRGCLLADWDGDSYRVVVGSIYLDQHWIAVVHPAPIDPFSVPIKRVEDLLSFDPRAGALQRVKVAGQLIHRNGNFGCLVDGRKGLRFSAVDEVAAQPGDAIEAVGFLELGGPAPVLREAAVRKIGRADMPIARRLEEEDLLRDEYDALLVQIEGVLLDTNVQDGRTVMDVQAGLLRFTAELNADATPGTFEPGSRLVLTGTYLGMGGNRVLGRPVDSFKLLLNSKDDIRVLSHPPWWTLRRMLNLVGMLAVILAAALVWIKLLRRTVEERTEELGNQIRERQRAERQRQVEQERARLAHDLHDDLGARLTEVNMLATLVKSPATSADEKKKYAGQLNEIALQMVTSLDEIVWAVNPRNDTLPSMAGYFGAYAQRLLELASVGCGLDVDEELPDCPLDPRFRQEIFFAFKEALSNIIQHAGAGKVWLRIGIEGELLVVTVADDGCGIDAEKRRPGADGLSNMQERMQALGGNCRIQSDSENGTTVRLEAPMRRMGDD